MDGADLAERAEDLRAACADPRSAFRLKARDLGKMLLQPLQDDLKGAQKLTICPDGPLWNLPWAALLVAGEDGEQFALQRYELSFAQSATLWQVARKTQLEAAHPNAEKLILAMANPDFGGAQRFKDSEGRPLTAEGRPLTADARPLTADARPLTADARTLRDEAEKDDAALTAKLWTRDGGITPLPGTAREATAIQNEFPQAEVLSGEAAQEARAKSQMPKARWIHFATHGWLNDVTPMLSAIVLADPDSAKNAAASAEDGFLTAREILDLRLDADLVVLSACTPDAVRDAAAKVSWV